ncbi:MAG TPA: M20 family metallopeptidase [Propionibacteriaceae bacterium]|nr:M20 family metallopeptidase [Propionibacteriaceae bacterium]
MTFATAATEIQPELVDLRRALHREPEIGLDLPLTQRKILDALAGLPLEISTGTSLSSVVAVLRGGRRGPAVLLRGDMDALPVTEDSGVEYASTIRGVMQACGHDLHVTMLVGAARLLSAVKDDLPGDVVFMFQPGEEGQGGAMAMIDEGVLDAAGVRPVAAFGLHVTTNVPQGVFQTRPGILQAAVDEILVRVVGSGGHGSAPHEAHDPIPAACEMVLALQTMVTRRFSIFDPVVVTVGSFHAGTKSNIIPDDARFDVTLRTFSAASRETMRTEAVRLIESIATAHGLRAEVDFEPGYPPTVNDADEMAFARDTVTEVFGADRFQLMADPIAGAEDFSYVLERVPGCFLFYGTPAEGADPKATASNHSAHAVFDDQWLGDGAALLAELAMRKLTASA